MATIEQLQTQLPETRPMIDGQFEGNNLLSIDQFTREDVETVLELAANFDARLHARNQDKRNPDLRIPKLLDGYVMQALMFEASSRTADGYLKAAAHLGATTLQPNIATSSQSKGEIDVESVICFARGADGLLIRHGREGFMDEVAPRLDPRETLFTSGGNPGDHVTQSLKDYYTMGQVDGRRVILAGHMSRYRAAISFLKGLGLFEDVHVTIVAPESGRMPADVIEQARGMGVKVDETDDLRPLLKEPGFFYIGRPALEYAKSDEEKAEIKAEYAKMGCHISSETMRDAHPLAEIAHPLPHNGEIDDEFYTDPRAVYNDQQRHGLPIHMAVLSLQHAQSEVAERITPFPDRRAVLHVA